ncbi:PREDICTED: uncharacterized protein LOC104782907 [Camelina sativa]|uniref:Uncharacterized protein LOC104782907 n=1 Tax=Camelina sativa TaxID=90675 RepID=A0ABM0YV02_CAMSA|nr:PREDICTED: uncharacterized protein LOC104782907 [Camelina sativa]
MFKFLKSFLCKKKKTTTVPVAVPIPIEDAVDQIREAEKETLAKRKMYERLRDKAKQDARGAEDAEDKRRFNEDADFFDQQITTTQKTLDLQQKKRQEVLNSHSFSPLIRTCGIADSAA